MKKSIEELTKIELLSRLYVYTREVEQLSSQLEEFGNDSAAIAELNELEKYVNDLNIQYRTLLFLCPGCGEIKTCSCGRTVYQTSHDFYHG